MTASMPQLLTVGRVSVDLYPLQSGVPLAEVSSFTKSIGGSPTNVAIAAARLGRRAAVVTRVGDDGFGEFIRSALDQKFGVDMRCLGERWTKRHMDLCHALPLAQLLAEQPHARLTSHGVRPPLQLLYEVTGERGAAVGCFALQSHGVIQPS